MLSALMITRVRCRPGGVLLLALGVCLSSAGCEKVPLFAPAGSSITLTASATALPINGTTQVIAQVIENSGQAPHSGTHVQFLTTLGSFQPDVVETDSSGRAVTTFRAGAANGTATITASSGGVTASGTNAVKISVGTAAVGRVLLAANPSLVPATGGTSTITANVVDINGNPLTSAAVSFSTTAGNLDTFLATTDQNGNAVVHLTTSTSATVTANVGAQGSSGGGTTTPPPTTPGTTTPTPTPPSTSGQATATVTVGIASAPTLVITPPETPPSAGLPAAFTFEVTAATQNGSAVKDLRVSWGDGLTTDLGAVTGKAIASHVYTSAGTYTISATLTDTAGNVQTITTSVTVIPVPKPTIIITPSPVPGHVGAQTTLTIQVTVPTGIGVQDMRIDFGDSSICNCNSVADLGGATSAAVPHVYTAVGTYTVTVTITDTSGQTTVGTAVVSIAT